MSMFLESSLEEFEFLEVSLHVLLRVWFGHEACGNVLGLLHPQLVRYGRFIKGRGQLPQRRLVRGLKRDILAISVECDEALRDVFGLLQPEPISDTAASCQSDSRNVNNSVAPIRGVTSGI